MALPRNSTRHLTADIEAAVLFRLLLGHGYTRVAKELRLPRREIRKLQLRHGLKADMDRHTPTGDTPGFVRALRAIRAGKRKRQYVKTLAERYGLRPDRALRLAHEVFGVERFVRGVGKDYTPLQPADELPSPGDVEANRRIAGESR